MVISLSGASRAQRERFFVGVVKGKLVNTFGNSAAIRPIAEGEELCTGELRSGVLEALDQRLRGADRGHLGIGVAPRARAPGVRCLPDRAVEREMGPEWFTV